MAGEIQVEDSLLKLLPPGLIGLIDTYNAACQDRVALEQHLLESKAKEEGKDDKLEQLRKRLDSEESRLKKFVDDMHKYNVASFSGVGVGDLKNPLWTVIVGYFNTENPSYRNYSEQRDKVLASLPLPLLDIAQKVKGEAAQLGVPERVTELIDALEVGGGKKWHGFWGSMVESRYRYTGKGETAESFELMRLLSASCDREGKEIDVIKAWEVLRLMLHYFDTKYEFHGGSGDRMRLAIAQALLGYKPSLFRSGLSREDLASYLSKTSQPLGLKHAVAEAQGAAIPSGELGAASKRMAMKVPANEVKKELSREPSFQHALKTAELPVPPRIDRQKILAAIEKVDNSLVPSLLADIASAPPKQAAKPKTIADVLKEIESSEIQSAEELQRLQREVLTVFRQAIEGGTQGKDEGALHQRLKGFITTASESALTRLFSGEIMTGPKAATYRDISQKRLTELSKEFGKLLTTIRDAVSQQKITAGFGVFGEHKQAKKGDGPKPTE